MYDQYYLRKKVPYQELFLGIHSYLFFQYYLCPQAFLAGFTRKKPVHVLSNVDKVSSSRTQQLVLAVVKPAKTLSLEFDTLPLHNSFPLTLQLSLLQVWAMSQNCSILQTACLQISKGSLLEG